MAKQQFIIGSLVNIGFVKGLRVVSKIPTPGDYAPDAYALVNDSNGRWYRFVPHHGLERCSGENEATSLNY